MGSKQKKEKNDKEIVKAHYLPNTNRQIHMLVNILESLKSKDLDIFLRNSLRPKGYADVIFVMTTWCRLLRQGQRGAERVAR